MVSCSSESVLLNLFYDIFTVLIILSPGLVGRTTSIIKI